MHLKCTFDDKTSSYPREKEREREGQRERGCTVHNTVSDHLNHIDKDRRLQIT